MALQIASVRAVEILDSRSRPTLAVMLTTTDGATVRAGVPSGASTGTREAVELRDGDPARFGGKGVRTAVGNVNGEIAEALTGRRFADLAELDRVLIDLDGTATKSRLGRQRHRRGLDGRRPRVRRSGRPAAVALPHPRRGDAAAAGAALQRGQRRRARPQPPRLPGVHDRPGRRAQPRRGGPRRRRGLRRPAHAAWPRPGTPPAWATRAASPRTSPPPRTSWPSWSPRSPTPATPRAATGWRSRWTRRPASSTATAPTTSPGRPCPPTT